MINSNSKIRTNKFLRRISTLFIMTIIIAPILILFKPKINEARTLSSLKKIDNYPLFIMNYYDDYKFDKYLEIGSNSSSELNDFLRENLHLEGENAVKGLSRNACTTFSTNDNMGNLIYGRNLDLPEQTPALILFTRPQAGYASVSMVELSTLGYNDSSQLTIDSSPIDIIENRLNLLAAPYVPRDGMNEEGLVVATLDVLPSLGEANNNKVTIGRWQALRLMLDYARNVDEAVALLKKYNSFDGAVHYFIADAEGNSAVLEYQDGEMKVIKNTEKYHVLTNFQVSSPNKFGEGHDRYTIVSQMLKEKNGVVTTEEAMEILKEVADNTQWSVIYNLSSGEITIALHQEYEKIKTFKLDMKKVN